MFFSLTLQRVVKLFLFDFSEPFFYENHFISLKNHNSAHEKKNAKSLKCEKSVGRVKKLLDKIYQMNTIKSRQFYSS